MTPDAHLKQLLAAVRKLLRPLIRILLRNGVSYGTFAEIVKWVYVDLAGSEFAIEGRKQTTSRVSVLTGLSRKEVKRMKDQPKPDDRLDSERYNRAARVIAAWRREAEYLDADGRPAPLSFTGSKRSFSELARRFSGDVPARAILDEMIRIGAVERSEKGRITLLARAYIPVGSETEKLHILGADAAHLIATIDHNLRIENEDAYFQRKVSYDNLPDEALPRFRSLSAQKAQTLLEYLDHWLSRQDRDLNPAINGSGRNLAGIGIYYFEAPYSDEENQNESQ